jgi:hypothetical protein
MCGWMLESLTFEVCYHLHGVSLCAGYLRVVMAQIRNFQRAVTKWTYFELIITIYHAIKMCLWTRLNMPPVGIRWLFYIWGSSVAPLRLLPIVNVPALNSLRVTTLSGAGKCSVRRLRCGVFVGWIVYFESLTRVLVFWHYYIAPICVVLTLRNDKDLSSDDCDPAGNASCLLRSGYDNYSEKLSLLQVIQRRIWLGGAIIIVSGRIVLLRRALSFLEVDVMPYSTKNNCRRR